MVVRKGAVEFRYAGEFVGRVFGEELHAKRVQSLTNATVGVMTNASLAVSTIGHGLALAQGSLSKHAIKQVDRLLSNPGIDVKELFMRWVPSIVGSRESVEIAMDWTDFDADNQTTIMLSLCAVERRDHPVGGRPTRQLSLQPVAIGAVVEVTKRLKPSMERVT